MNRRTARAAARGMALALLLLATVLPAGGRSAGDTLTVFAAASLTKAFREIGQAFEQRSPGVTVTFHFAASSLLRAQIEQGAPADLFASADREQMEPLVSAKRVRSPVAFARNRLVIVVPAANPGQIRRPYDLARPGLRLAMTAAQVPIGRYTRAALEKMSAPGAYGAGFREAVLRSVVSQEANVRGLLARVELGELDAAIVYASDVRAGGRKVKTIAISPQYNVVAVYPAAVIARSPRSALATRFLAFLRSGTGKAVLKKYGFQPA